LGEWNVVEALYLSIDEAQSDCDDFNKDIERDFEFCVMTLRELMGNSDELDISLSDSGFSIFDEVNSASRLPCYLRLLFGHYRET
jgi:hypothetical protein